MGNRTAKFVSALVGSIIAGAPLAAVSQNAPTATNAAADCLASPKGAAPQGQRWHYRLERTTKRQCWYLRAAGEKDSAKVVQATADTPPDSTASPQQTVQDARAEYVAPRSGAAFRTTNASTPAASTPSQQAASQADSSAQPAVAVAWPDVPTASTTSEPQPAPITVAAAAQPSAKPSKSPIPQAAADVTTDKPAGSVQMLLLVIGGALALAGILASLIYRFAGGRVRVQAADRRGHWDDWTPQEHDGSRAPWRGATPNVAPHTQPGPVDFDEARPQTAQLAAFTREISIIATQSASIRKEAAELDKADIFHGAFEIQPRQLAATKTDDKRPVARDEIDRAEDVRTEDAVDVDVITAMLERLAKQGPRLREASPEAGLANLARNQRGQSAARA